MRPLPALLALLTLIPLTACGGMAQRHPSTIAPSFDPQGRLLARTARLDLEVDDEDDFGPTFDALETLTAQMKGHVVERTQRRLVFKVPAERLDQTLKAVEGMGELTDRWVGAVDVTAQHTDLTVRVDNLRRLQARLRQLVDQAEDVSTVLQVEKELGRVTTELEQLEAQLRALNGRVALAQVQVNLEEEVSPGPVGWVFYGLYSGLKWLVVWD